MAVYTLFSQAATGSTLTVDPNPYTMGVQFSVNVSGSTLTGVWFFSPSTATVLPQTIALYAVAGASLVHSESATWSGAAGSGWVRAAFSSPPSLTSGTSYKACILQNTSTNFYGHVNNYWDTGTGSGGITNGPLSATNNAGGDGGQDTFTQSAVLSYPATSFNATNYWVDPEVTTSSAAPDVPQIAPGPVWMRLFKPQMPKPRPVPPAVQNVSGTGSLSLAPLAVAGTGAQTSPDVPQAQPGPFWLRLFRPGLHKSLPPVPAVQAVNATGSLTLAPLSFSGQGGQSSPDVPQAAPGPVWQRLFRPWLHTPVPPVPAVPAVSAAGSLALAPLALSGAAGQTSPDQPQAQPGPLWLRLFKPWAPRPLPPPPALPAVSAAGSLTLAPLTLAGSGAQSSPDIPETRPGPFWLRLFKPGLQRPVPPPPAVQGVSAAGSLALAPLVLSGAGGQTSPDTPQAAPGPVWLRLFKPWVQRPVPQPPASSGIFAAGSLALAPLNLTGQAAQTSPDVPGITPGPVWLRLFRPWQPRQVPPLPGPSPQAAVTSTGSLTLAPLTLAGTGAQTSPDAPAVQPGPVWSRLFRPWAARPVPPPPAIQGINAAGSLALAPLAVAGQGAQTSPDQPETAPGPFWLRLFRPWQPRPAPPPPAVQGVSAAGSLTLAPLGVAGSGSVKGGSPDQPQAQPGPVWLRLFKPWIPRPAPVNAGQGAVTITSSGGITLAPLKVSGNAEGPAPVFSAGAARQAWTFGGARWKWTFGAARNR